MPHDKNYYTAGEMAKMFNLSKQTMLYYDRIGLLQPEFVTENGYRHYSLQQFLALEVISNLRKLDISVSDIQKYLDSRSPEALRALLEEKDKNCREIIEQNENVRKNIGAVIQQLEVLDENCLNQITLNYYHPKKLYLSRLTAKKGHMGTIYMLASHNQKVYDEHHFKERAVGWIIDKDAFFEGKSGTALAYFSTVSMNYFDDKEHYYEAPAGLYITLRFKGTFHSNKKELAKKIGDFMQRNNLVAVSNLFVQPLKNYWMCTTKKEYINQVTIQVEKIEE